MPRRACNPPPATGVEACRIQAEDPQSSSAEFCNPLMKSEFRSPAALADPSAYHPRTTRPPSTFCLHPMYFMVFRASEVLRIRILDVSEPRSSKHYANYALWELRIRNLDTSGPRSSIHYANHAVWELRIRSLNTSGRSFSVFFSRQSINSTKFKRVDPQDDDF